MTLAQSDAATNTPVASAFSSPLLGTFRPVQNPLPKAQLAAVYTIKLLVPLVSLQILPYVNQMIEDLHLSGARSTGYYSGLVSTAFTLAQLLSVYPWARLSDRIGRVPVVVIGTAGLAVFSILFGLSRTFEGILVTRFLAGICCGIIGALHSIVGELSDTTNASTAFPLYDICSALGFIIGPMIGGTLANPATRYPSWFDYQVFREYPYLLACSVTSALAFFASALAAFFLRETNRRPTVPELGSGSEAQQSPLVQSEAQSIRALLSIPALRTVCLSSGAIGFIGSSFNTVFVLAAYTAIPAGGLSLGSQRIALALSLMGALSIALKLALPLVLRRHTTRAAFLASLRVWPLTFAVFPLLGWLARRGSGALWPAIAGVLFLSRVGCLTFGLVMILVKENTPALDALGAANGISEVLQMVGVGIGATFISSSFAFSTSLNGLGGLSWVVVIVALSALVSSLAGRHMMKGDPGIIRLA